MEQNPFWDDGPLASPEMSRVLWKRIVCCGVQESILSVTHVNQTNPVYNLPLFLYDKGKVNWSKVK
jgi:hypothetical protein